MKKNLMKTMVATICVVATGMGGMKAYNAGNQSDANVLLAENVEALSQSEVTIPCVYAPGKQCTFNAQDANGTPVTITLDNMANK